jgi:hypothetical protein
MERKKCHCNGSRGTDCDWCGGSGWKKPRKNIIYKKNNEIKESVNKDDVKEINKKVNEKINKNKNYIERLETLKSEILEINTSFEIESYIYIKKRIIKFNKELNEIKNRISKNEKKLFEDIKNKTEKLIAMLEKKIKHKKTTIKYKNDNTVSKTPTLNNKFGNIFKELKKKLK